MTGTARGIATGTAKGVGIFVLAVAVPSYVASESFRSVVMAALGPFAGVAGTALAGVAAGGISLLVFWSSGHWGKERDREAMWRRAALLATLSAMSGATLSVVWSAGNGSPTALTPAFMAWMTSLMALGLGVFWSFMAGLTSWDWASGEKAGGVEQG